MFEESYEVDYTSLVVTDYHFYYVLSEFSHC